MCLLTVGISVVHWIWSTEQELPILLTFDVAKATQYYSDLPTHLLSGGSRRDCRSPSGHDEMAELALVLVSSSGYSCS